MWTFALHVLPEDYVIKWKTIEWDSPDDCYDCQVEKAKNKSIEYSLPELNGSEKQKNYANIIRVKLYEYYLNDKIVERIKTHIDAKYWINCKIEYMRLVRMGTSNG